LLPLQVESNLLGGRSSSRNGTACEDGLVNEPRALDDSPLVAAAVQLAASLLREAESELTPAERRRRARLGRLLADRAGRDLLFALTDQVLRFEGALRSMRRLRSLVAGGLPHAVGPLNRAGLRIAAAGSSIAPELVSRLVWARIRAEVRGVILAADDEAIRRHWAQRRDEGLDLNVNLLGEAILGDAEAETRIEEVCRLLRRADVDYVSVKVSALCANLDVLAFDHSVDRISECLRRVFRVAMEAKPPRFVNLDMEEYHDLHLTVDSFQRVLSEPEFHDLPAGIALQAYLPDSHAVLEVLCDFAAERRRSGGSWIKVRIVKGANLAMEQVEAELAGWLPAPYATKVEVDASFKRLLATAVDRGALGGVHIGVGTHNLFDVAWALGLREQRGAVDRMEIEMIEGMAPAQARAVRKTAGELLLYAPIVSDDDFAASIAYLARRLDENTGSENFLRALFSLSIPSAMWDGERERFAAAVAALHTVSTTPRRSQRRRDAPPGAGPNSDSLFSNEPDTDFSLPDNRHWIEHCLATERPAGLPDWVEDLAGVEAVVSTALRGSGRWGSMTRGERRRLLARAAEVMCASRGRTLAVMALESGKTVREGDPEVSEAIDHARWASTCTHMLDELDGAGLSCEPVGVVVVAGPWNFPYAIPANGVLSALAAGNVVILKPAPEAVATGLELVRQLHLAGIPPDALQLVRCPDDDVGRHLVTHPQVGTVVLTGAYETASMFHEWKPSLRLLAETSGKNALVMTASADLDLALADLVRSAFGHAGQKCSAASLAIVEADLYDQERFRRRLADAVTSLRVGPATDPETMVGPLIHPPSGSLRRALEELDPGESWLVEPLRLDGTGHLWRPGVKMGVQPGSWFHRTECFGPVLGVMRADDLNHALELQNSSLYGLTGGLHSLDPDEIDQWLNGVQVGNAYVNRHTTGAIVRRQPFGGWKRSSVGPTVKAGGPDYLLRLVHPRAAASLPDGETATASYRHWWNERYSVSCDLTGLRAESNVLRYLPLHKVVVRTAPTTEEAEIGLLRRAASVVGVPLDVSAPLGSTLPGTIIEEEEALARRIASGGTERLRVIGAVGDELARACHRHDVAIDDTPVTGHGRVELPCWVREQAISRTLHRHGRISTDTPVQLNSG
jgi:RHH-type transcriptional regulator, proline utilization regulon repressor / proline dehydrogenase / delta 1-pyrroline-5-carboxylate dehydrogenase